MVMWSIGCSDRDESGGGDGTVNVVYKMISLFNGVHMMTYIWLDKFSVVDLIAFILCRTLVGVHYMAFIICRTLYNAYIGWPTFNVVQ